jgi:hypothetical protein
MWVSATRIWNLKYYSELELKISDSNLVNKNQTTLDWNNIRKESFHGKFPYGCF